MPKSRQEGSGHLCIEPLHQKSYRWAAGARWNLCVGSKGLKNLSYCGALLSLLIVHFSRRGGTLASVCLHAWNLVVGSESFITCSSLNTFPRIFRLIFDSKCCNFRPVHTDIQACHFLAGCRVVCTPLPPQTIVQPFPVFSGLLGIVLLSGIVNTS